MSIQEIGKKLKGFLGNDDIFMVLLIILVALVSFGLGRMSVEPQNTPQDGVFAE